MKDLKDVIILVLIAVIAGACLSVVYVSTAERIAEVKRMELLEALKKVMPFLKDSPREIAFDFNGETILIYAVEEDGVLEGAAVRMTTREGYGGDISFLMGVGPSGEITGFYLLSHKETPGLGTKAADRKFWGQFIGKSLDNFSFKVKKDKGDVEAITAATITSRALSQALEKGLKVYRKYRDTRGGS
ncbi:RnfABCDGE type electron transport complex subunit G [bacterium]|nr:RnfABCDGE type electron transport complex subunit G [candidate division CSSED10-310 bacterium]